MVIKVLRNADDWTMIDGIEQIQVNRVPNEESLKNVGCVGTVKVVAAVFDPNRPDRSYTQILYQDKRGEWCSINFNTEAFICSDFGKTIERIFG